MLLGDDITIKVKPASPKESGQLKVQVGSVSAPKQNQKIICVNLSDMSAMGAKAKSYTLNLSINSKINYNSLILYSL